MHAAANSMQPGGSGSIIAPTTQLRQSLVAMLPVVELDPELSPPELVLVPVLVSVGTSSSQTPESMH